MLLELPNSTRRASRSELMPCSSGEEVDHSLVGHGWGFSWAVAGNAQSRALIARRAFDSRCIAASVRVRTKAWQRFDFTCAVTMAGAATFSSVNLNTGERED